MRSVTAPLYTDARHRWRRLTCSLLVCAILLTGCSSQKPTGHVIFLDGAGHLGSGSSVKRGLRDAGYDGDFHGFVWTSFLLWGVDHLVAARSERNQRRLIDRIKDIRRKDPAGYVAVMGLSAGCAVVMLALENMPDDLMVNDAVFLQPSISSNRDLSRALAHVKGRMIVTSSRRDAILAGMAVNADGGFGRPAGRIGFRIPNSIAPSGRRNYRKLVTIPWKRKYRRLGWGGGHVTVVRSDFIENVIGPYIVSAQQETLRRKQKLYAPPAVRRRKFNSDKHHNAADYTDDAIGDPEASLPTLPSEINTSAAPWASPRPGEPEPVGPPTRPESQRYTRRTYRPASDSREP